MPFHHKMDEEKKVAKDELKVAKDELKAAEDKLQDAKDELLAAKDELLAAKDELQDAKYELKDAEQNGDSKKITRANVAVDTAQSGVTSAQSGVTSAQSGVTSAQSGVESSQNLVNAYNHQLIASLMKGSSSSSSSAGSSSSGSSSSSSSTAVPLRDNERQWMLRMKAYEAKIQKFKLQRSKQGRVTSSDSEVSGGVSAPSNGQSFVEVKCRLKKQRQNRYRAKLNGLLKSKFSINQIGDVPNVVVLEGNYRKLYFACKKSSTLSDFQQNFEYHRDSQDSSSQ